MTTQFGGFFRLNIVQWRQMNCRPTSCIQSQYFFKRFWLWCCWTQISGLTGFNVTGVKSEPQNASIRWYECREAGGQAAQRRSWQAASISDRTKRSTVLTASEDLLVWVIIGLQQRFWAMPRPAQRSYLLPPLLPHPPLLLRVNPKKSSCGEADWWLRERRDPAVGGGRAWTPPMDG